MKNTLLHMKDSYCTRCNDCTLLYEGGDYVSFSALMETG